MGASSPTGPSMNWIKIFYKKRALHEHQEFDKITRRVQRVLLGSKNWMKSFENFNLYIY
jgi:hypothetical protein